MKSRNTLGLAAVFLIPALLFGCSALDKTSSPSSGLIATPASYYSTARARLLGEKYKANLESIVAKVVRNPKTVGLQFANNIASVGGIGFFTHSAATVPDERYLEVVLAAPELFEIASEPSSKFHSLFSKYGYELLAIMMADVEMFEDRDIGGYGLNLSWRKVSSESGSPKVTVERAVAYFTKAQARAYLRRDMNQADLFKNAIVFAGSDDGSMALVSLQPKETPVDFRPAIIEENLPSAAKPEPAKPAPPAAKAAIMPTPERTAPFAKPSEPMIVVMKSEPIVPTEPPAALAKPEPAKAAPPAAKAAIMPTPERTAPFAKPSEPMIVVMKSEPPVGQAKPVELEAAAPTLKMPAPERSPGTSLVAPPVIVMVAPPAPTKAPVEARAGGSADTLAPASKENLPPPPAPNLAPLPEIKNVEAARADRSASKAMPEPKTEVTARLPAPLPSAPVSRAPVASTAARPPETSEPVLPPLVAKGSESPAASAEKASAPPSLATSKGPSATLTAPPVATQEQPALKPMATPPVPPTRRLDNFPEERKVEAVEKAPAQPAVAKMAAPAPPTLSALPAVEVPKPAADQLALSAPGVREAPPPLANEPPQVPVAVAPSAPMPSASSAASPAPERLAALPKVGAELKPPARPTPKALAGYIVQIAFSDAGAAQRWAESMERKGFAVSVTEAGEPGAFRVRFGNFSVRADAERQLVALRQEGLRGIVLNLPQAFLPEAASLP